MDPVEDFRQRVDRNIKGIGADRDFLGLSNIWIRESIRHEYAQNFTWLGRPSSRCRRTAMPCRS